MPSPPIWSNDDGVLFRLFQRIFVITALACVALGFAGCVWIYIAVCVMDDPIYTASSELNKTWEVSSSPEIVVDLNGGPIFVVAGPPGRVSASLTLESVSMRSQARADSYLKAMLDGQGVDMTQDGSSIRIKQWVGFPACSALLKVPANARLELHTGAGDINVGSDGRSGNVIPFPVASLKARQDSFGVLTANLLGPTSGLPPLDLEGTNLRLTLNGKLVGSGTPVVDGGPEYPKRWHYVSK